MMQGRFWPALFAIVILQSVPATALPEFPDLTGRVVDEAGVLRSSTESAITEQLRTHEAETSNQVVVVTVRSLQGYSIEEFGVRLGIHWRIGQQDRDNGVLLIVAPNERKVRIEVGLGLEGVLTDSLAKTIIDAEILPSFRRGNLERGVRAGVDSILAAIAGTYEAPVSSRMLKGLTTYVVPIAVFGIFGLVLVMLIRDGFGDGGGGQIRVGGYRYDSSVHRRRDDNWSSGSGDGSSGGGFSGGGGSFGGGGSSGSW